MNHDEEHNDSSEYYTWYEKCPICGGPMKCWELNDHTAAGERCENPLCNHSRLI